MGGCALIMAVVVDGGFGGALLVWQGKMTYLAFVVARLHMLGDGLKVKVCYGFRRGAISPICNIQTHTSHVKREGLVKNSYQP